MARFYEQNLKKQAFWIKYLAANSSVLHKSIENY